MTTSFPLSQRSLQLGLTIITLLIATFAFLGNWEPNYATPLPPTPTHTLPKAPQGSLHAVFMGDTGSGAPFQFAIRDQLLALNQYSPYTALFHVGDIIYPRGNYKSTGKALYTDVYQPLWKQGIYFYPVLGNHDVVTGFEPGILKFYSMPQRYYQTSLIQGDTSVDFFGIDTNIPDDAAQRLWLKDALSKSTAPWKVVYGHHPLFSSGAHGDNTFLHPWLLPLFKQYGVQLYIAGHDHGYERFAQRDGVLQLITGGGGAYLRGFSTVSKNSLVRIKLHNFLSLRFLPNSVSGVAIGSDGTMLDNFTLKRAALVLPVGTL